MTIEIIFLGLLFIAIFFLVLWAIHVFSVDPTRKKASQLATSDSASTDNSEFMSNLVKVVDPISKLSLPSEGWENSPLHIKFITAGLRHKDAPKIYFAIKTLLTFGLPLLAYIFMDKAILAEDTSAAIFKLLLVAAIGYYIPSIVLASKIKKRKREIAENLPDATDLLIICMEAGLSFDQALTRVAKEISLKSEVLSQELELVQIEIRSGFSREKALRNLALRTGVEEIDSMATMVIQSERFGTSVGESLRVHAETSRTKRRQEAEETASKIALKLLFPLILCLLPAIFVVLLVPSIMQIQEALS